MTENEMPQDVVREGAMSINEAVEWSGLGRTRLYEAMNDGSLPYIKAGKRRLIPRKALRDLLARGLESGGGSE